MTAEKDSSPRFLNLKFNFECNDNETCATNSQNWSQNYKL